MGQRWLTLGCGSTTIPVTLPDGTAWGFNLRDLTYVASVQAAVPGNCEAPGAAGSLTWSGSITHPSGLTGTFSIAPRKQGRSYVPQACWGGTSGDPLSGYALTPNAWYGLSVTQKTFSGAGLPQPATWNYQYSAANESWTKDCAGSSCPRRPPAPS